MQKGVYGVKYGQTKESQGEESAVSGLVFLFCFLNWWNRKTWLWSTTHAGSVPYRKWVRESWVRESWKKRSVIQGQWLYKVQKHCYTTDVKRRKRSGLWCIMPVCLKSTPGDTLPCANTHHQALIRYDGCAEKWSSGPELRNSVLCHIFITITHTHVRTQTRILV